MNENEILKDFFESHSGGHSGVPAVLLRVTATARELRCCVVSISELSGLRNQKNRQY